MSKRVAIVTGGASGMGLAVTKSLLQQGWAVVIIGVSTGNKKVADEVGAAFFQADVSDYEQLGRAFAGAFALHNRLDFVFANAGIIDREPFYDHKEMGPDGFPAKPDISALAVDLDGVVFTCYLGLHFLRKSSSTADKSMLITASTASFYPSGDSPYYAAAKHGCVGFMRSVAPRLMHRDGIRVNSINPSNVVTGLLGDADWSQFPAETFTPMEKIVDVFNLILADPAMHGQAIEIEGAYHSARDHIPWGTEMIERATVFENQV